MSLVVDTSVLINIEKGKRDTIEKLEKLRSEQPGPPFVAFISYFEFIYGIRERNPKNKTRAIEFIELFDFLASTKTTARILSDLKHKYDKTGKVFSLSDLMIASQAIENNLILVTEDKKFKELQELNSVIL
jgi:tRNA(fMet)-specific endonuclease VapC